YMDRIGDSRTLRADAGARYFGALLDDTTLVPGPGPRLGAIDFETWFSRSGSGT
ncbi:NmrA family transcriptional regulator, partial [Achromobacter xylosoxidans]|nr:NmrA family transcriptional regulator [Achromobacter xylosoxidans]